METMRAPIAVTIDSRTASTAKDARPVNCYVDTESEVQYVYKRPGSTLITYSPTISNGTGYGLTSFNGKLYSAIGTSMYEVTSAGATTSKGTISAGRLSFAATSETPYLFFHNGSNGYTINGSTGAFAEVTDVDFPTKQTPALTLASGAVYLDDMVFVMTTTGRIYNSAIENPTSWGALDYISKTAEPDGGVAIAKHLSFILTWGSWSTEFFYNAGIATGSPLDRAASYKANIGCASGDSVVTFAQTVAWLGQAQETGRAVYMMEGTTPIKISTAAVERYLNASTLVSLDAFALTIAGHTLYVLNLPDLNITLVCDINEKRWYQWSTDSAGSDIVWKYGDFASLGGVSYVQNRTTGKLSTLSTTVYQEEGNNINYRIVTPRIDMKSNKRKFWKALEVIGDKTAGTLQVRHSDDDYTTWSSYRNIDISLERPILRQLGSARRRAYELFCTSNVAIKLQAIELVITEGTF